MVLRKHYYNGPIVRQYSNIRHVSGCTVKSESSQLDLCAAFYEGENHDLHFNHTSIAHSLYQIYLCDHAKRPLSIYLDYIRVYIVNNTVPDLLLLH